MSDSGLVDERSYLRALVDSNPLAIVIVGPQGLVRDCNPAFEELFGYERDEAVGEEIDALVAPAEERDAAAGLTRKAQDGEVVAEVRRRRKDGSLIDVRLHAVRVEIDGRQDGAFAIYQDVSERRRYEESLAASESKYRKLFQAIADPIFIFDRQDHRFLDCNDAVTRVYGYDRDEIREMTPFDLHPPEDLAHVEENIDVRNVEAPNEYVHLTRDGRRIDVEIQTEEIRYDGRPAWLSIVRDITAHKEIEEELRRARDAAEQATEAKSSFLANMSHEIRTPMNAIIGMTELVLETDLEPEQREFVETVQTAGTSLLELINDILDFSRIEAGKLELEEEEFSLVECVETTIRTLALRAHEKGLELACEFSPDVPPFLVGDAGRIRQVVVNLVGNAVKFTDEGEIVVSVSVDEQDDETCTVAVEVSDTGIGIPESKQEEIFESFSQADVSTSRKYGGTGLGLAICGRLVEAMGGGMSLESEEGVGSTFRFTARLPIGAEEPGEARQVDLDRLEGFSVLVVDDNATNRRILVETLEHWGLHPVAAGSAAEALEALDGPAGRTVGLALIDGQMPERDGFDLVEEIRGEDERGALPIIMLTSAGRAGDAARCRELEIDRYLTKPVPRADLREAVRRTLANKAASLERVPGSDEVEDEADDGRESRVRVLLAEDNEVNVKLAVTLLEKAGHSVEVAENGERVVEILDRSEAGFDLVLMDVEMPGVDGIEATGAIRARNDDARDLPIIGVSAHAMEGQRQRCLDAGMDGYLTKPFRPEELLEAVRSVAEGVGRNLSGDPGSGRVEEGEPVETGRGSE